MQQNGGSQQPRGVYSSRDMYSWTTSRCGVTKKRQVTDAIRDRIGNINILSLDTQLWLTVRGDIGAMNTELSLCKFV